MAAGPHSIRGWGQRFFTSPPNPYQFRSPHIFMSSWLGHEPNHSPPSCAEINAWSYTSTLPLVFMVWHWIKHRDGFINSLSHTLNYMKCISVCLSLKCTQVSIIDFSHDNMASGETGLQGAVGSVGTVLYIIVKWGTEQVGPGVTFIGLISVGAQLESQMGHQVLHGFPQSLQANTGVIPQLGNSCFLRNPFQFIIHWSSRRLMLSSLDTE
jgi:hypothetical protein